MGKYWLLDQQDVSGPTVLVETDGSLHITGVVRFGPGVSKLKDQQKIWDAVAGQVAPTLKPCVEASSVDEEGVAPHEDLKLGDHDDHGAGRRAGQRNTGSRGFGSGRIGGGPGRTRSRGDR